MGLSTAIYFIKLYKTLVLNPRLLSNGYIKVGGVFQHGISMSFEYLFRSVKQYARHESIIEIGEQMSVWIVVVYHFTHTN